MMCTHHHLAFSSHPAGHGLQRHLFLSPSLCPNYSRSRRRRCIALKNSSLTSKPHSTQQCHTLPVVVEGKKDVRTFHIKSSWHCSGGNGYKKSTSSFFLPSRVSSLPCRAKSRHPKPPVFAHPVRSKPLMHMGL